MSDFHKYRAYYKTKTRLTILANDGKCPLCEILLTSKYHTDCEWLLMHKNEDTKEEKDNTEGNGTSNRSVLP